MSSEDEAPKQTTKPAMSRFLRSAGDSDSSDDSESEDEEDAEMQDEEDDEGEDLDTEQGRIGDERGEEGRVGALCRLVCGRRHD